MEVSKADTVLPLVEAGDSLLMEVEAEVKPAK